MIKIVYVCISIVQHSNRSVFMDMTLGQQLTKVKQLADLLEHEIVSGKYSEGSCLPSINGLSKDYCVSRDTVFKAFLELRERKLIDSIPGKGYYVTNRQERVFLLLDEYSLFKNTLYNSFVSRLGRHYKVDLWFHQYNEHIFNTILREAIGRYNYYVVMNFDNEKFSPIFNKITPSKLLLLDFGKFDKKNYSYICQNFDNSFYAVLCEMKERLRRYRRIVFHLPKESKHPYSSVGSLQQFCAEIGMECEVDDSNALKSVDAGVAYMVIRQTDVVDIIKMSRAKKLECGRDFGLIAYNETPAYEVIDKGITSLSVDWVKMGDLAAQFIVTGDPVQIFLPTELHLRDSV